jgi:hypothetical protein
VKCGDSSLGPSPVFGEKWIGFETADYRHKDLEMLIDRPALYRLAFRAGVMRSVEELEMLPLAYHYLEYPVEIPNHNHPATLAVLGYWTCSGFGQHIFDEFVASP